MAGETTSTNMGMPIPGVGSTVAPTWASDLNASLTIVDAHDHTNGNGVAITPSGMNINADLTFSSNSATSLKKAAFTSQSAALTGTNFLTFVSGNLYVNDGSGNQIPITSGGGVAGSPGSIGSLSSPAAATYSAGSKLFTWTSGSTKAAAMDNGAVKIRETDVAAAKGITLASPTSLAADYQITLPSALPASTQAVTLGAAGTMSTITYDNIGAAMTSTGVQAILSTATAVQTWSPTITCLVGSVNTTGGVNAQYYVVGKLVFYIIYIRIVSISGGNSALKVSLPTAPELGTTQTFGSGFFLDSSLATNYPAVTLTQDDNSTMGIFYLNTAATLAVNDSFYIQGFYPVS